MKATKNYGIRYKDSLFFALVTAIQILFCSSLSYFLTEFLKFDIKYPLKA